MTEMMSKLGPTAEERFARVRTLQAVHQRALEALAAEGDAIIAAAYDEPGATLVTLGLRFHMDPSRAGALIARHTKRMADAAFPTDGATDL
jgi:hypothetical protein